MRKIRVLFLMLLACTQSALSQQRNVPFPNQSTPMPPFPIQPGGPFDAPAPFPTGGRIKLDVVVTDHAGKPVTGLEARDFTVLDDGQPQQLVTFQAFNAETIPNPPIEIILVIDSVNLSAQQTAVAEHEAEKFLRQNRGFLTEAVSIYRLTDKGLSASWYASTNGNDLATEIAAEKDTRVVWAENLHESKINPTKGDLEHVNAFSLRALGTIILEQRRKPGRKMLIWLGPGWPVSAASAPVGVNSFDWVTELSTRMREARVVLNEVTEWPGNDPGLVYEDYVKGVKTSGAVTPASLALPVLAAQSGGRVLQSTNDLPGAIATCVSESGSFYTLTFNPPRTERVDEYHDLKVQTADSQLTARTSTGYYDQPVFYDQPGPPRTPVTVEQLEQKLKSDQHLGDRTLADELSGLHLTERLGNTILTSWKGRMPGSKSRAALVILAADSEFLEPPPARIPPEPTPDMETQREMLFRTIGYLEKIIPKLPDFYATRATFRYTQQEQKDDAPWKTVTGDQRLSLSETSSATVLYRNGHDELDAETARKLKERKNASSLNTEGTFGPIRGMVLAEAAQSNLQWNRWEEGSTGRHAVFQYSVPKEKSHYTVSFCCLNEMYGLNALSQKVGYHGEITIDAETGEILRLTVQAELEPGMPVIRADMLVSYAPVQIGGKTYVCPVRSIAIGRRRTLRVIHEWGDSLTTWAPYETMLNDVTFSNYHMSRSEMRILPGFTSAPE